MDDRINKIIKVICTSYTRYNNEDLNNFSCRLNDIQNIIGYKLKKVILPVTYNFVNVSNNLLYVYTGFTGLTHVIEMTHKTYTDLNDLATDVQTAVQTVHPNFTAAADPLTNTLILTNTDGLHTLIINGNPLNKRNFGYIFGVLNEFGLSPLEVKNTKICNIGGPNIIQVKSNLVNDDLSRNMFGVEDSILDFIPIPSGYGSTVIYSPNDENWQFSGTKHLRTIYLKFTDIFNNLLVFQGGGDIQVHLDILVQ